MPIGRLRNQWLVLARDRRLLRFDAEQSLLTPLEKPTPSWFPGPLNWPWIGREESTGRVWVYGRGRVLELYVNFFDRRREWPCRLRRYAGRGRTFRAWDGGMCTIANIDRVCGPIWNLDCGGP